MSLFNRAIRPPPTLSDEAIERYLAALHDASEPDPLFRRRLRSDVVNQFVAAREGIGRPVRIGIGRRQMGRVGRACLYASFTLGVSAASVMAASQEALPGEALYPLKQRIEELRWDILPGQLHGELAAYALGERIEEMARLADAGQLDLAIAMAPAIDREYERLVALGQTDDEARAARIERHLLVLEGLLDKLPANAQAAVENVIERTPGLGQGADAGSNPGNAGGPGPAAGGTGSGPEATVKPTSTPKPDATPKPDPTPRPEPTVRPTPTPRTDPAGRPERPPRGPSSAPSGSSD
ncbi:MAG TPA: hypothetical protein VEW95_07425 [Candidatus Limnocylindrales bacterium]|nr:hypothetical protein [Candidatus Limnocylindrales bacterium]